MDSIQNRQPIQDTQLAAVHTALRDVSKAQVVNSATLFVGRSEVEIDHHGVRYRLRQTAQGKLILTK